MTLPTNEHGPMDGKINVALINYWVIGTNRETLVVVYERKFVRVTDAKMHRDDMEARFPADIYHVQRETYERARSNGGED